jgi:hypothetical protein
MSTRKLKDLMFAIGFEPMGNQPRIRNLFAFRSKQNSLFQLYIVIQKYDSGGCNLSIGINQIELQKTLINGIKNIALKYKAHNLLNEPWFEEATPIYFSRDYEKRLLVPIDYWNDVFESIILPFYSQVVTGTSANADFYHLLSRTDEGYGWETSLYFGRYVYLGLLARELQLSKERFLHDASQVKPAIWRNHVLVKTLGIDGVQLRRELDREFCFPVQD